jgi:tetratricopeptide (TPR) repeat protein
VGLYRTLVADKRMLVLLDNARDADQVRPFLPGSPGSLVVVTSRKQLAGLVTHDGAHPLAVDVLTTEEAMQFLEARLGQGRVAAERRAAEDIVERCAHLPLALTIVAARAAAHSAFSLTALAGELREARHRLDSLNGADALTDVRAVFTWSYRTLTPDAARLFRLIGLHPGPDMKAAAAASLAAVPPERVRPLLTELASLHMILEPVPGRYASHDLLRAYAVELAAALEPAEDRRAAVRRLLDHYLDATHAAALRLNPHRDHPILPIEPAAGVFPEAVGNHGPALWSWLAAEHAVLLASVGLAVDNGMDRHAWQLAWTLGGYLARSGRWEEWAGTQRVALAAVERLGDPSEQARAHRGLARAYRQLGRVDEARTHLKQAERLSSELDDQAGLGYTHLALGQLFEMGGDLSAALDHAQQALTLFERVEDVTGKALALNSAGWCRANLADYRGALTDCTNALVLQRQLGDPYGQATTWDSLGFIHHHLGELEQAIVCYQASLDLRRNGGERYGEAHTLIRWGDTKAALGDTQEASEAWTRAGVILEELDHSDAGWARHRLDMATLDIEQPS